MSYLHVFPVSANAVGPMAFVAHCELKYETKIVDLMKGEHKSEDFLKLNPYHTIPTLSVDGWGLWESNSILRYLAVEHKLEKYYPTDAKARAKVDQVLDYRQTSLYAKAIKSCYSHLGFTAKLSEEDDKKLRGEMEAELDMFAKVYLSDGRFAAGFAEPTIADFSINSALCFIRVLAGLKMPKAIDEYTEAFIKACPKFEKAAEACTGYVKTMHDKQLPKKEE